MSAPHGDGQQLVEQLGLFCQRWTRRRVSYRPAGEIFDPRFVSIEPIEESIAKAFSGSSSPSCTTSKSSRITATRSDAGGYKPSPRDALTRSTRSLCSTQTREID